jgi:predicted transcriptional regulator YheO
MQSLSAHDIMDQTCILFDTLRQMADGITATFGNNCEVAIHDLSNVTHSLVYITGNVTNRPLGSPVTDAVIKEIVNHGSAVKDRHCFKTITDDGREIKSTTLFIRNSQAEVIAAFCINFDVTDYLTAIQALEMFAGIKQNKESKKISEKIAFSIDHTIETLFEEAVKAIGKRPATMSTEDKVNLVRILERKGVFQIKGVINQIALQLGVTNFTVYNYLKKIRAPNGSTITDVLK